MYKNQKPTHLPTQDRPFGLGGSCKLQPAGWWSSTSGSSPSTQPWDTDPFLCPGWWCHPSSHTTGWVSTRPTQEKPCAILGNSCTQEAWVEWELFRAGLWQESTRWLLSYRRCSTRWCQAPLPSPVCLCCSLQVGKLLCRCRCSAHFSSEHFWVALLASAAPGPSGPGCCHLTCGGPAQQELPVWDLSFAPLWDVFCISLLTSNKRYLLSCHFPSET